MIKINYFPQFAVTFIACGGSFLYGISLGWSAPSEFKFAQAGTGYEISVDEYSWVASILSLGGASSCVLSGVVRNSFGTKLTIFGFSTVNLIGWSLLIFVTSPLMLIIARFLIGAAVGAYAFIIPIYLGEIASNEIRGKLITFFEVSLALGMVFSFVICSTLEIFTYHIICASLVIIYAVAFIFLPETPLYLVQTEKIEEAKKSIKFLRLSDNADKAVDEMKRDHEELSSAQLSFFEELGNPASRKAFIILIFMFFFLQVSGMNAVGFYATSIFQNSGINIDPLLATCIIGTIQLIFVVVAAFVIDKFGRKFLLLVSFTAMAIGMFGIGAYFHFKSFFVDNSLHWLPLLLLCIFTAGFALGAGPIPFVLTGELFSQRAKKILAPSTQIVYFFMAFVVTRVFTAMVITVGNHFAFYVFGVFCILGLIFVVSVLPETKGKSFYEIQKLLTKQKEQSTPTA